MKKSSSIVKTDKQIVDAVMSDQRKGQDLMVGRYGQEVFGMVVRLVGDVMDAEELTQDTFLRAFRCSAAWTVTTRNGHRSAHGFVALPTA